jgi:hypothetical protein
VTVKYSKNTLASALAPAVGEERASELISEAMRELGVHATEVTAYEARALFDHISRHEGVVGVSARIARARLANLRESDQPDKPKNGRMSAVEVCELLAPSVGQERARELVEGSCRKLGFSLEGLGREEVSSILDDLAATGGVVSVVARFAKARALLKLT